ncbi:hypothetical protein VNI00_014815 [Paramarasmius palmivorus]|uniref:Uncharacterized protein n=1 Tax=Paramarasmius palmivorus TaxID=297713 RepID=A0AAW0BQ31_9AGAR
MTSSPQRSSNRRVSPTKKIQHSSSHPKTPKIRYCRKCKDAERHEQRLCPNYKRRVPKQGVSPLNQVNTVPPVQPLTQNSSTAMPSPAPLAPTVGSTGSDETREEQIPIDPILIRSTGSDETIQQTEEQIPIDPTLMQSPSPPHCTTLPALASGSPFCPVSPQSDNPFIISGPSSSLNVPTHMMTPPHAPSATPSRSSSPSTPSRSSPIVSAISRRGSVTPSCSRSSPTSKRIRATVKNPVFGTIVGAYRGSRVMSVSPSYSIGSPLTSTRRCEDDQGCEAFPRAVTCLTHCEDLAHETGCWLYLSAQLPTANVPFTHFTSERLRAEGGAIMDEIHDASDRLYDSLMSARRRDNAQLASEIIKANRDREAAREGEAAALDRLSQMEAVLLAAGLPVPPMPSSE